MFYTERLMLRAPDIERDLPVYSRMNNNEWNSYFSSLSCPRPSTISMVRDKTEANLKAAQEDKLPQFAICLKPSRPEEFPENLASGEDIHVKDGRSRYPMIGVLGLKHTETSDPVNRCLGFGVAFDAEFVDKGYGTEVVNWLCEYVFDTLGMHRLQLSVKATNLRAARCYEKAGFIREGVLRETLYWKGEWVDLIMMGILQRDWRAAKASRLR